MKFSRLQIFLLLIMFIGISNHVILLPHLLEVSKRDAWIASIIAYFIIIIWALFLRRIINKLKHKHLQKWLNERTGKLISTIIIISISIYILLIAIIAFNDLINTVQIYFLPSTSIWIIAIPFIIICVWAASANLKTIVYSALLLLPFVIVLGYFVAIATFAEKDYSYLFPIFTEGVGPVIQGIMMVLGANVDFIILFLLQDQMKKQYSYFGLLSLIAVLTILILGPTLGSIASFGPEVASQMRFPAFEQWRLVSIGQHVSHLDYFAVFQLLSGVFIRLSLCIYVLWNIWNNSSSKLKWTIIGIIIMTLIVVTIPENSDVWIQKITQNYFYYGALIFGVYLTTILVLIGIFSNKGENTNS
ncbi:endospore germination permease [Agaribacter marinus]|uniref:Endospore germination permease n=1 Tax=Virgibacillus salarius TaxID=447199 RepID=A0A941DRL7_9BACI|nr:endospore germination permease [Virgibacillus salarius]MBR7794421.1 endospore germination permease [Virgibacillus salarius]NAZ07145.1 endospore germination permease [Agaribacter marinus]